MEKVFFQIPIYRCTHQKHLNEIENLKIKFHVDEFKNINEAEHERYKWFFYERYNYDWKYNEIIGWINLYFYNNLQIDYWLVEKRRINSGIIKKKFVNKYRLSETANIDFDKPSKTITEYVCSLIIESIKTNAHFKNRHIDFETFKRVDSCLDWKRLREKFDYYSE